MYLETYWNKLKKKLQRNFELKNYLINLRLIDLSAQDIFTVNNKILELILNLLNI